MKVIKVLLVVLLSISIFPVTGYLAAQKDKETKDYLIVLKDNVDKETYIQKKVLKDKKLKDKSPKKFKHTNSFSVSLTETEAKELKTDTEIKILEEDSPVSAFESPQGAEKQEIPWGISTIGSPEGFKQGVSGTSIKVAILDTGVSEHQDLEIKGGISFVKDTNSYTDDNGHGTHVAGTLAALDNQFGVVGAAPNAEIYAVKVLNNAGEGSYSQVIQGIEWAMDHQINIISMSLGGMTPSEALHEEIKKANQQGILLIASAGNFGLGKETEAYPARYPEVLSIGAVDDSNTRASFSSTGTELDFVAPGVNILSTTFDGNYGYKSGTSMAAPHVAGAAAEIWSKDLTLTNEEVKQKLIDSATPLGDKNEYGYGLVNVAKALGLESPVVSEKPSSPNSEDSSEFRNYDSRISKMLMNLSKLKEKAEEAKDIDLSNRIEQDANNLVIEYNSLFTNLISTSEICYSEAVLQNHELSMEAYFNTKHEDFLKLEQYYQERIQQYLQELGLTLDVISEGLNLYSGTILENNRSIDADLGIGASQVFTFTPTVTMLYTIYTSPYGGGISVSNDTLLEVFTDPNLSNRIAFDDNYECTTFSQIKITLTAGTTYYVKLSPASELDSVFARLSVTSELQTPNLQLMEPQDVNIIEFSSQNFVFTAPENGSYRFATTYYGNNPNEGESDTVLYVYSDSGLTKEIGFNNNSNGTTFSSVDLNLSKDSQVYIKLTGNRGMPVHSRIDVTKLSNNHQNLSLNVPIDVTIEAGQFHSFAFTPSVSGKYHIFTGPYGDSGSTSDTYLKLFEDPDLTELLAENDNTNGTPFSSIKYQLNAGQTYYIYLSGYAKQAISSRLTINQGNSQYVYDAAGRLDYMILEDGKKLDFQYDPNGNLVKKILINK